MVMEKAHFPDHKRGRIIDMKRWIGIAMLIVPLCASAQSFWDGSATVRRGDAGFESGLFAVSNSFAPDTRIVIQNLDTGQSTTATVTSRMDGESDVLLLLSPLTATAIGIPQGAMARVRVTLASPAPAAPRTSQSQEQVASRDPDINPGAAYPQPALPQQAGSASTGTASQAATAPQPSEESLPASVAPRQAASSPAPVSSPEAPRETEKPAETPAQTTTDQTATAQNTQQADQAQTAAADTTPGATAQTDAERKKAEDAAIIAAAQARSPQKQLFLPPREDERFAYHKPAETPAQAAATTTPPAAPQITAVIGEPTVTPAPTPPADLSLADAVAPRESRPQEIVGAETTAPSGQPPAETALAEPEPVGEPEHPVQTEVTGPVAVPAAPARAPQLALAAPEAPPEHAPQAAQTTPTPNQATPRQVPTLKSRGSIAWYLQLAAYTTEQVAQDLAKTLVPTYPTLVLSPQAPGARSFRVVIGPLNRAESGTLLTWFRDRGFPDAFVKKE